VPVWGAILCRPTSGKVWLADCPPPTFVVGFFGFVAKTVTVPLAGAVARSACGTVIVSEVPAAFAFPPVSTTPLKLTVVEALNPVPLSVICWSVVAPAIRPKEGENEDDRAGITLSMFVGASVADLSLLLASLGSATVAVFVTLGNAPGAAETVRVNVLFPPAAASAGPEYVHVTACPVAAHDQLAPAKEAKLRPAGKVSVTVMLPVVGPVPELVTLIV